MDDRRVALLVAGVGLVVVGVIAASFPRGMILGLMSVTVGVVLGVHAAIKIIRAPAPRMERSPRQLGADDPDTVPVPGVSFWRWSQDTGWGTTPWGVSARLLAIAVGTAALALLSDMPTLEFALWADLLLKAVLVLSILSALFLPAWVIERITAPRRLLPRSADLAFVVPAIAGTAIAGLVLTVGGDLIWVAIIVGAQLLSAVVARVVLARQSA